MAGDDPAFGIDAVSCKLLIERQLTWCNRVLICANIVFFFLIWWLSSQDNLSRDANEESELPPSLVGSSPLSILGMKKEADHEVMKIISPQPTNEEADQKVMKTVSPTNTTGHIKNKTSVGLLKPGIPKAASAAAAQGAPSTKSVSPTPAAPVRTAAVDEWSPLRAVWHEICPRVQFEEITAQLYEEGYLGVEDLFEVDGGMEGDEFKQLLVDAFSSLKKPELRRLKKKLTTINT